MNKKYLGIAIILALTFSAAAWQFYRPSSKTAVKSPPKAFYVAMGDSVAAGVGLSTDSDSSACNRTDESYPKAVAAAMNLNLKNFACSAATLKAGVLGSQNVNQLEVPAQLEQMFAGERPDYITLTVGANDAGWISLIGKCFGGSCGSAADTAAAQANLVTVSQGIKAALKGIQDHYDSDTPRVAVTGYHQVFPAAVSAGCSELSGLDAAELTWARAQQTALNTAIEKTVKEFDFAHFAAVDFTGHELCSSDSWVQGAGSREPYHPTKAGQAEYSKQTLAVFKASK